MALLSTERLVKSLDAALLQRSRALRDIGIAPTLSVILAKGDPPSSAYFRAKRRLAEKLEVVFHGTELDADGSTDDLLHAVRRSVESPSVHGVFLEMPLPANVDAARVRNAIPLEKDVDCVSDAAIGRVLAVLAPTADVGHGPMLPATPRAVIELLRSAKIPVAGAHAVVVGRSLTVGRPLALLLLAADATVTVCHSRTVDLAQHTRRADILCVAAGKPHLIGPDHLREGVVVIDIGIHATPAGLVGDVDTDAVIDHAAWVTPVPGGVGALTTRMVFANLLRAAESTADPSYFRSADPLRATERRSVPHD